MVVRRYNAHGDARASVPNLGDTLTTEDNMHAMIHWLLHRERNLDAVLDWRVVIPLVVGGALLVSFLIAWSK